LTEHQDTVNAIYQAWREDKAITFFLVKANEKRQETVPFRECLPSIIKLWKKQGWLLIDAEMSIVKVKITDDMPLGD
jgi:hypothetical protein